MVPASFSDAGTVLSPKYLVGAFAAPVVGLCCGVSGIGAATTVLAMA
jgi:hypothetical protein